VRLASRVERDWLEPTEQTLEHRLDETTGTVRALEVERYDALVLLERPARVDPERAAALLAEAYLARGPRDEDVRLLRRLAFAGQPADLEDLVRAAARAARRVDDISLRAAVRPDVARALDALAPERLAVPSGRTAALEYREDGTVAASVKLQELFGLAETPRVGAKREPVILLLLAPNGRPVQTTRDLKSFWERTYPDVRKELRGRYPKHPWPEDPWTAAPTARATRQARRPKA
jgi:ATP-dependent helicase HrpB